MPLPAVKRPTLPPHLLKELGASVPKPGQKRGSGRVNVASRKERRKAERQQSRAHRTATGRNLRPERAVPNRSTNASQQRQNTGDKSHVAAGATSKDVIKQRHPDLEGDEEDMGDLDDFDSSDGSGDGSLLSDGLLDEGSEISDDDAGGTEDDEDKENIDGLPLQRKLPRAVKEKLAQDDAEIAELERKLGLKNRKTLPKSFKEDGLADLLEGLGGESSEERQEKRKRKAEVEDWLAQKRRKAQAAATAQRSPQPDGNDQSDVDEEEDDEQFDEDLDGLDDEGIEDADSGQEDLGTSEDDFEGFDSENEEAADKPEKRVRENPYVAPTTGQPVKYVPPSLRKESGSETEVAARVRRQTQGLVNRITESNMLTIVTEVEKLYREHPRQHVTSSLVDLLLIQVCEPTSLPDTLLILSAGFATAAYMVLGTDFGGQLIQDMVQRFDKYYGEAKLAALERPDVPKQTSNLITFMSELYTFQLIGPNLIFDYIRMLLENLSELNAELLLRIVRMCGPTLRQDDPMALKDIVSLIPPAVARAGEKNLTVRTRFMIDTITDLKNNKMKAGVGASAVISEHIMRMKKLLGQLKSRKLKATEPMRVGLQDIRDADTKGKWWLVGASWAGRSGDPKNDQKKVRDAEEEDSEDDSDLFDDVEQGPDLGELAREQGMNTEVRRAIFVSIMSALDYQDAYLRILKLRLNKERQREIPNVIIRCVGAEQHYNPYYTLVAKRLCAEHREVRWAFQASLWRMFGRMGETDLGDDEAEEEEDDELMDLRRVVNTAKMFGALISAGSLGVTVLKRLNLLYLQKKTRDFVEIMLVNVLLECQTSDNPGESIAKVFGGAQAIPDLARGLRYFLKKVVRKSDLAGGKKNTRLLKEACKMAEAVVQAALANGEDQ